MNVMFFTAITALGQAFATVVNGICAVLSRHAPAAATVAPMVTTAFAQVYWRIARRVGRLDRLVQHWHAGTLPKPRAARPARAATRPAAAPRATPRTPESHAMLLRLAQPTAQFRGHLETFLERPDTRALLRAAPQAGRILRPLCRILAIDLPEYLRPPPRPRKAAASRPRLPASRPPPPAPGTPDRPLPANIRAAARAWKKYDR